MSDLSIIINAILEKANEEAELLIKEAEEKKMQIIEEAKAKAKKEAELIKIQSDSQVENIKEVSKSSAVQGVSRDLLKKKAELIKELIKEAKDYIYAMNDDMYNELLIRLLNRYAHKNETGKIAFCEKDKVRINSAFVAEIKKYNLETEDSPENIKGGFILKYGNIEENCSIEAIFRNENERVTDFLNKELFG